MSYPDNFLRAFDRLIGAEGAYTNDDKDPGNWTSGRVGVGQLKGTKYGIAANTYGHLDIANLTLDQAKAIYYNDWWIKAGGDVFPYALVYQMWQFGVNAGMESAKRCLQKGVGVAADGSIGPLTINKVRALSITDVLFLFKAETITYYTDLSKFPTYGRGWMKREAQQLKYCAVDS